MSHRCSLSGIFRIPRIPIVRIAALAALAVLLFQPARAGQLEQDDPFRPSADPNASRSPFRLHNDKTQAMTYQRIEQLNAQRHREMTDQATRLLQLATELNRATTASAHPSPSDLQKAETIGKLAHSVREAMEYPITP